MPYWLTLLPLLFCTLLPCVSAGEDSISAQIVHNLGHVDLWGLPRVRFNLGSTPELSKLGFRFVAIHKVTPSRERGAKSEWQITGLRTCLHQNKGGDMTWIRPDGRKIAFHKINAYKDSVSGWFVRAAPDGIGARLNHANGQEWCYKNGWLDRITDPVWGLVVFATDRESILQASRLDAAGNGRQILKIEYCEFGYVQVMEFSDTKRNVLSWSDDCCLTRIKGGDCGSVSLQYENLLLKSWSTENGNGNKYAWRERRHPAKVFSFGDPPVALREDNDFTYEYGTKVGINYIVIRDKKKGFVSETRLTAKGLVQILPDREIRARYKRAPDGRRILENIPSHQGASD
ncbi:hypothetical protein OH491_12360 [Termitidicoccus mucosus]|uniref:Uncharacterized protein n=1 Tax=Termitidicoccus mucosus TaxID=1184151 RepID=A0A178IIM1_9BACT|nr:hypothetical protein AW736_15110 [Opitutaceae bacterium TSB47]